jgi:creatinine amidohydrolase
MDKNVTGRPTPARGLWEELSWTDLEQAAAASLPVVLAVGSTEQHGPHLPVGTDCMLPVGVALDVCRRLPLVVAPPLRFGARSRPLSGGGESFPGNLSLRVSTLITVLTEVLEAIARTGFTQVCVQNWHYENTGALWDACDQASANHPDLRMLILENPMPEFTPTELDELFPDGFPGWDVEHAAIMETSMMMILRPDLVKEGALVDDEAPRRPSWDLVPPPPEFVAKSGVLWRATQATPDLGRRFLQAAAGRLEHALRTEFVVSQDA